MEAAEAAQCVRPHASHGGAGMLVAASDATLAWPPTAADGTRDGVWLARPTSDLLSPPTPPPSLSLFAILTGLLLVSFFCGGIGGYAMLRAHGASALLVPAFTEAAMGFGYFVYRTYLRPAWKRRNPNRRSTIATMQSERDREAGAAAARTIHPTGDGHLDTRQRIPTASPAVGRESFPGSDDESDAADKGDVTSADDEAVVRVDDLALDLEDAAGRSTPFHSHSMAGRVVSTELRPLSPKAVTPKTSPAFWQPGSSNQVSPNAMAKKAARKAAAAGSGSYDTTMAQFKAEEAAADAARDEAEWEGAAERQPLSPPGQRRSHERRSSSPSILVSCHYSRSPPGQRRF